MNVPSRLPLSLRFFVGAASLLSLPAIAAEAQTSPASVSTVATVPGMPPVIDPSNLYSEATAGKLNVIVTGDLPRVYVPNLQSNDVYVIDPMTMKVVDRFRVGVNPQHVVPSWDLRTLWVANNAENRTDGSLTPVDPKTGKPGRAIPVDDPYNMYFSPDGKSAIVVAEALKRLDFRDPQNPKRTVGSPATAEFPLIVQFVTVMEPELSTPPPKAVAAAGKRGSKLLEEHVLPLTVELVIINEPEWFDIPPPTVVKEASVKP